MAFSKEKSAGYLPIHAQVLGSMLPKNAEPFAGQTAIQDHLKLWHLMLEQNKVPIYLGDIVRVSKTASYGNLSGHDSYSEYRGTAGLVTDFGRILQLDEHNLPRVMYRVTPTSSSKNKSAASFTVPFAILERRVQAPENKRLELLFKELKDSAKHL